MAITSARGITEFIGVRAVILDLRQYLADGRKIESANKSMAFSTIQIERASRRTGEVAADAFRNQSRAAADVTRAYTRLAAAQADVVAKTKIAQTATVAVPGAGNQVKTPPQRAADQRALEVSKNRQVAAEESLVNAERRRFDAALFGSRAVRSAQEREIDLLNKQKAAEAELAAAQAERRRIAATTVAVVGAAAIVGGTIAAVAAASKFQTSLVKIDTLTNATTQQTKELGDQLLNLSKTVPSSPDDLGAAAYQVLSSGIQSVGKALEITTLAAQASALGLGNVKDVAGVLTTIINTYGVNNIDAAKATDILVTAVKEGRGEAKDFAASLGRVLPVAAALGVEFDQVAAALAVLTNGGLSAEEAATGLRAILNDLAKGTPPAEKALKSVRFSAAELRLEIRDKGLPAAMEHIIKLFQGNLTAIEPIIPNIRGLVAAYSAFVSQGGQIVGVQDRIRNSAGVTKDAFAEQSKTFAFQAAILKNELSIALIKIGTAVLPTFTKALRDLIVVIDRNQVAIQQFLEQGLKGLIGISGSVLRGLISIVKGLVAIEQVFASITSQKAATVAALTAIGVAMVWALPGGPYIKGLLIIAGILDTIKAKNSIKITSPEGLKATPESVTASLKAQGAPQFVIDETIKGLKKAQDEYRQSLENTNDPLKNVDDLMKKFGLTTLPDLNASVGNLGNAAELAQEKLLEAEKNFTKTSEAAGEALFPLTENLKLFGQISAQQAHDLGITATQAGNVQGLDAVTRSQERARAEAFNLAEALAAVASAFQKTASVGQEIVLRLAQSALEASKQAAQNLFARPTREVANLNVNLSQAKLHTANVQLANDPRLRALQQQLRDLNRQAQLQNIENRGSRRDINDDARIAREQRQKAIKEQNDAAQAAADAAQRQLDQLKFNNLQAQIAYERLNAGIQDLIDANTKHLSDLQASFLQSNDNLQRQINTAVSKGQTGTALGLTGQQQQAAKNFQAQQKSITQQNQNLTFQQAQLKKQEEERQRAAQLAEAALELQTKQNKAIQDNTDAANADTNAFADQRDAIGENKDALDLQRASIQDQIDAITNVNSASSDQEKSIQDQIDVYQAQSDILKANIDAADQTLLTQQQQATAAGILIGQIYAESSAAKVLADTLNISLIPGFDDAAKKFDVFQKSLDIINNPNKLIQFIDNTFDAGAQLIQFLNDGAGIVAATVDDQKNKTKELGDTVNKLTGDFERDSGSISRSIQAPFDKFAVHIDSFSLRGLDPATGRLSNLAGAAQLAGTNISNIPRNLQNFLSDIRTALSSLASLGLGKKNAEGGIYSRPTTVTVGETYQRELILPLERPQRARQLLAQVPPQLLAGLFASKPSNIFSPSIQVSGETLDTMEAMTIRTVQRAFRDARSSSARSGSLITQSLGPGR